MKKTAWFCGFLVVLFCATTASAQFKSTVEPQPSVAESMLRSDNGGLLFGWFDPSKFNMRQSFSLSYQTFGGQGMSLGVYTNSLSYQFSDALDVRADVSLMASPFNSFGKQAQSSLSGLFLNRAELNYRPWKNTLLQVQFQQYPGLYGLGAGYGFGSYLLGGYRSQEENR